MNLYQIIQKRGTYETQVGTCQIQDSLHHIVSKDSSSEILSLLKKIDCDVQDLSINLVCNVGQIIGAHFIPTEI